MSSYLCTSNYLGQKSVVNVFTYPIDFACPPGLPSPWFGPRGMIMIFHGKFLTYYQI